MKICHLADVHFRGLSRHDEYRRAFQKMFVELKLIKPDVIAICGDIVHSKTQGISPELIDQLTWWFNSLAEICPVHVILGNHDGNLMNPHRQDAISPVINALSNPSIHLYKESGVYDIMPGFKWCVFSIFDEAGWKNVKPVEGAVNIALFHGSVAGSTTDQGWHLDADLNVGFFENYDFCLLGDIHKKQFLAYRDDKPWIGYPGSTIMQSYGEQPGKGYLLWDIKTRNDFTVEFHPVEHDCEFWSIDWKGNLRDTLEEAKRLPHGSRIRIKSDVLIPQLEIKQLSTELLSLHGATEVVFKDDYVIDSSVIDTKTTTIVRQDLRNVETIFKLFKGYFSEQAFTAAEWDEIHALIDKYMQRANADDSFARNVRWSLKNLEFDNTFGYGKGNQINFRHMSGITGIFGPNRAGKSSIIGTMLYTLFNGTDRGSIKNLHIINSRKTYCQSKLLFSIDDRDYCIERQTVKHDTKGITHAVTNLNFAEIDSAGEVLRDLNGEQRTDTEKVVRSLVGSPEDCMLTAIAAQGDMNKFIDAGSSYRDQVISRFLDLVIFEKMSSYAKEDTNLLKVEVKNAPDKDWDTLIMSKGADMKKAASEILRLEKILKEKRTALDALRVQLATSYGNGVITQTDVDKVRKKIERLRNDLLSFRDNVKVNCNETNRFKVKLSETRGKIESIPIESLKKKLQAISVLKDTLAGLKQRYEKEMQVLLGQKKSILRLADVPCGDQFPDCKYIKDSYNDKNKIKPQQAVVEKLLEDIQVAERSLSDLDASEIEAEISRHSRLLKEESDLTLTIVRSEQQLENYERNVIETEKLLVEDEIKLTDYVSRVVDDDGSESLKASINELQRTVDELDSNRVRFASKKGSLYAEIVALQSEKEKFKSLRAKWKIYEMFIAATSKKGIPAQIVQSQLPLINTEIARILHGVVDYTIKFEKDEESNTTEIYIDYGDSARLIELSSGMEKMIGSLAIRVALQNASALPRPDFIVIDEGFGSLDESNIEACNRLLVSLKQWFKNIIVISHIDAIKDIADNVIEVTRTGKDSHVEII